MNLEARTPDEPEARILEARTPETTPTMGPVPANLQFARGPAQVDLSVGRQTCSRVAATVTLPLGDDIRVAVAVLTSDDNTDEDFAFMVTNGPSLQDVLQQGDTLIWRQAIDSEVASLQHHRVFRQVNVNQSGKIIPTKIILVETRNYWGKFERYKARLVAQGFFQPPEFDFDAEATYAPTMDLTVLRLLLEKAASDDLAIWQCDVKTAYLQREREDPVLARLPKLLQFEGRNL